MTGKTLAIIHWGHFWDNHIRAIVYFNWQFDGVDWRIETSQAAMDAWRAGITCAYYYPNQFGSITSTVAVP